MDVQFIDEISKRIESIPSLPSAALKLIDLVDSPYANLEDIAKIVSADQGLALRILQTANSAFYDQPRKIGNIAQAVSTIGLQALRNLALGLSVMSIAKDNAPSAYENMESFWRHSLATGIAARQLGKLLGLKNSDEGFTAGLIHDMGKIILMSYSKEIYDIVVKNSREKLVEQSQVEREVFEINHTDVGAELCRHWKIPTEIADAVGNHHSFVPDEINDQSLKSLAGIVCVADQIAKVSQIKSAGNDCIDTVFLELLNKAKVSMKDIQQILRELPIEVSQIEVFFGLSSSADAKHEKEAPAEVILSSLSEREKQIATLLLLSMNMILKESPSTGKNLSLDFTKWKKEHWAEPKLFPIGSFRDWINEEINPHY